MAPFLKGYPFFRKFIGLVYYLSQDLGEVKRL
jgi:hypothetical protein